MLRKLCMLFAVLLFSYTALFPTISPKASMEAKLAYLQKNSAQPRPNSQSVQFTEQEINAFIAGGGLKLPTGVESLRFEGAPDVITTYAKVDFDRVRAGSRSMNPLLAIFSGLHDVVAVAHGEAARGEARIHIDSVSLDGVEVPNFALALFAERFIQPKHPELGIDSHFRLPERIDSATVGSHVLTVQQK